MSNAGHEKIFQKFFDFALAKRDPRARIEEIPMFETGVVRRDSRSRVDRLTAIVRQDRNRESLRR
jgi:hypothetical protein